MKPVRDPLYLKWIKTLPCVVMNCRARWVDPAHIGPHGLRQKASDYSTVPLCRCHHEELGGAGGRRGFETKHNLDLLELAQHFSWKPAITIRNGCLFAIFGDRPAATQEFDDSPTDAKRWPRGYAGVFDLGPLRPPILWDDLLDRIRVLRTEQLVQEIRGER